MAATADRGRDVLVPNLLSFSRIPLAGLLWVAPSKPLWALTVLALAGVSDVLDGWWVRRIQRRRMDAGDPGALSAHAARGAFIDGLADKIFVVSAAVALATTMGPPLWALAMLAMREILFLPLMLAYRLSPAEMRERVDFSANRVGKLATFAQFTALALGLLQQPRPFLVAAVVAGVTGTLAALDYAVRAFTVQARRAP